MAGRLRGVGSDITFVMTPEQEAHADALFAKHCAAMDALPLDASADEREALRQKHNTEYVAIIACSPVPDLKREDAGLPPKRDLEAMMGPESLFAPGGKGQTHFIALRAKYHADLDALNAACMTLREKFEQEADEILALERSPPTVSDAKDLDEANGVGEDKDLVDLPPLETPPLTPKAAVVDTGVALDGQEKKEKPDEPRLSLVRFPRCGAVRGYISIRVYVGGAIYGFPVDQEVLEMMPSYDDFPVTRVSVV